MFFEELAKRGHGYFCNRGATPMPESKLGPGDYLMIHCLFHNNQDLIAKSNFKDAECRRFILLLRRSFHGPPSATDLAYVLPPYFENLRYSPAFRNLYLASLWNDSSPLVPCGYTPTTAAGETPSSNHGVGLFPKCMYFFYFIAFTGNLLNLYFQNIRRIKPSGWISER